MISQLEIYMALNNLQNHTLHFVFGSGNHSFLPLTLPLPLFTHPQFYVSVNFIAYLVVIIGREKKMTLNYNIITQNSSLKKNLEFFIIKNKIKKLRILEKLVRRPILTLQWIFLTMSLCQQLINIFINQYSKGNEIQIWVVLCAVGMFTLNV